MVPGTQELRGDELASVSKTALWEDDGEGEEELLLIVALRRVSGRVRVKARSRLTHPFAELWSPLRVCHPVP